MRAEFTLPGGLLDDDGACHRAGELRPLSGFDEEWVHALPPSTRRSALVTGLLARCVKRLGGRKATRAMISALTIGDREFLLLKLYEATFGDVLSLVLACPRCSAKMDLDLRVAEIPVEERPVRARYRVAIDSLDVEFRLPSGEDQERLAQAGDVGADELRERLLDACVQGGARALPPASKDAVVAAVEANAPRVETELEVRCPECDAAFDAELDPVALVLGELDRGRAAFERELHLLAFHYHWPLRDLLSLTRPRRQRFLRLLVNELEARG